MDAGLLSAIASIGTALAVIGGFIWTIYRTKSTASRQAGHDLLNEQAERIKLRDEEIAKLRGDVDAQRKQVEWLQRRNVKLMAAVSKAYNIPEGVIDLQLNGGAAPEVRH